MEVMSYGIAGIVGFCCFLLSFTDSASALYILTTTLNLNTALLTFELLTGVS